MGLIQSLLGSESQDKVEHGNVGPPDPEGFAVATPIVLEESQLQILRLLVERDRDVDQVDDPFMKEAIDDAWKEVLDQDKTWSEEVEEDRRKAEKVLECWVDQMEKETDIVYCTLEARHQLRSILIQAESRSENERDPFEIPEGVLSELEPLVEQFEEMDSLDRNIVFAPVEEVPLEEEED